MLCPFTTVQLFAWFSVHREQSLGITAIAMTQAEGPYPCLMRDTVAILWPSRHPTPVCGIATSIAWTSEQPNLCLEGANSSCLAHSSRLSNQPHRNQVPGHWWSCQACTRAHQHRSVQGPSPAPKSRREHVPTGAKSEYQRHESCTNSSGFAELN